MAGYGIVGCGYSGRIHAESLKQLEQGTLVSVFDIDEKRKLQFAEETGAKAAGTLDELCEDSKVEAVIVATPNNSHSEPVLRALENKKHVFCEKPVSLSLKNVQAMIKAAQLSGNVFFAGHTTNFIRGVQTAKRLLSEGAIGRLIMIEAIHTDWAGPQKTVGWKQQKEWAGGHLYHHMHEVDLICQLAGLPKKIYAQGKNLVHRGEGFGDEEDVVMLIMELEHGCLASLTIGSAFHLGEHVIKLQGEWGGILLDFKNALVRLTGEGGEMEYSLHENEEEDLERRLEYKRNKEDAGKGFGKPGMKTSSWMRSIFYKELLCFDRLIRKGTIEKEYLSLADGTAAVNCQKVLDGSKLSMERGCVVCLEELV